MCLQNSQLRSPEGTSLHGGGAAGPPEISLSGPGWASLVAQSVKNLPAMQETQESQVQSLGCEDPLEKEMATHSSILAWRIPVDRGV